MRIDIMTLFPDTVGDMMNESILGRAQERDIIRIEAHQIRDYTANRQNQVDDYPYGGGHGAILQADPLYRCWEAICDEVAAPVHTIFLSPCGATFCQEKARQLLRDYENLILVCGHYEGIDQRFIDECVDEEISIGDFVLTGGELPAMVGGRLLSAGWSPAFCPTRPALRTKATGTGCWNTPSTPARAQWHGLNSPGDPALRQSRRGGPLAAQAVHFADDAPAARSLRPADPPPQDPGREKVYRRIGGGGRCIQTSKR